MASEGWDIYARSGIYGFIFIFGITGNLFVMFFFGYKMKRVPNFRWFVIHLAIADCTYAVLSPIQMLYLMFSDGEWHLGQLLCKLSYIGPITVNVSAMILCFMAYERYRAICHPFKERLSKGLINGIVVGIWILCILLKVPVMNRLGVHYNTCLMLSSNSLEHLFIALSFLVFESVLPLLLLTIFFCRITFALKESENFRNQNDSTAMMRRARTRSSTPSYYSGLGAPPTPKWKPPLSPPPLVTLDECESACSSLEYVNFGQTQRRIRGITAEENDKQTGVHFAFHRGRLYSGNSSCPDDVFESSPSSSVDIPSTSYEPNRKLSQSASNNQLSNFSGNIRNSYIHLRKYMRRRPSMDVGRHFGIHNKKDRDTVSALFLSVLMFALTSVPYNLNYFIITCVYLYSPNIDSIDMIYGQKLVMLNEWLGVLMLSGCIMNIIIYSGKFPQFRFQMFIWVSDFGQKISGKTSNKKLKQTKTLVTTCDVPPDRNTCRKQRYSSTVEIIPPQESRQHNDYVKV